MRHASRETGFTLIEVTVVALIIAIVAALAIPNLQNARKVGNETNTVSYLRSCVTASEQYRTRFGQYAAAEIDLFNAGFLEPGQHPAGYNITSYATDGYFFELTAEPQQPGITGDRSFFVDDTGVIRFEEGAPATVASPPLD